MNVVECAKNLGVEYNVTFRVIDKITGRLVQEHVGHNAATDSLVKGIGKYLMGQGILNQGSEMLRRYIPRYISLGTMGLYSQEADSLGLPTGIGEAEPSPGDSPEKPFRDYMLHVPGYGADGYDSGLNNSRKYFGLGRPFAERPFQGQSQGQEILPDRTVECELISASFPRVEISYREFIPEMYAEVPETIDVVMSAMISTGALAQFREKGKEYLFITEAGLWSERDYSDGAENGLLAGYRILPPDKDNWDMTVPENREALRRSILRVGYNQVVQVIWKIQIGAVSQLIGLSEVWPDESSLYWHPVP